MSQSQKENEARRARRKFSSAFAKWWQKGAAAYLAKKAAGQNGESRTALPAQETEPTDIARHNHKNAPCRPS
jgi:hypothetical protein